MIYQQTSFHHFAVAAGGVGGTAMIDALDKLDETSRQAAGPIRAALQTISHPLGDLVAKGGIAVLYAPVRITEGSQVNGNLSGQDVLGGRHHTIGLVGGIFQVLGRVTIAGQSQVNGNDALNGKGGGVCVGKGSLTISDGSMISGNVSDREGGGIWNAGTLRVISSSISENIATGNGGGLFNDDSGQATIGNSAFDGNNGRFGGGIANTGVLTIIKSSVTANTATNQGGGIFCDGGTFTRFLVSFSDNSPENIFGCR